MEASVKKPNANGSGQWEPFLYIYSVMKSSDWEVKLRLELAVDEAEAEADVACMVTR